MMVTSAILYCREAEKNWGANECGTEEQMNVEQWHLNVDNYFKYSGCDKIEL